MDSWLALCVKGKEDVGRGTWVGVGGEGEEQWTQTPPPPPGCFMHCQGGRYEACRIAGFCRGPGYCECLAWPIPSLAPSTSRSYVHAKASAAVLLCASLLPLPWPSHSLTLQQRVGHFALDCLNQVVATAHQVQSAVQCLPGRWCFGRLSKLPIASGSCLKPDPDSQACMCHIFIIAMQMLLAAASKPAVAGSCAALVTVAELHKLSNQPLADLSSNCTTPMVPQ